MRVMHTRTKFNNISNNLPQETASIGKSLSGEQLEYLKHRDLLSGMQRKGKYPQYIRRNNVGMFSSLFAIICT